MIWCGMEQPDHTLWPMLKRGHVDTCHKMSPKQLERHVREFAGRHNVRELDTLGKIGRDPVGSTRSGYSTST